MSYAIAVIGSLASVGLLAAYGNLHGDRPDLEPLILPVVLAAYLGGARAGACATAVVTLGGAWLTWVARWVGPPARSHQLLEWLGLLASSGLVTTLFEALHREQTRARSAESRHAVTLASIGDGVIATDRDERVSFLNPEAERLLEVTDAAARGRPLAAICEPLASLARPTAGRGDTVRVALSRRAAPLDVEATCTAITAAAGGAEGHVLVLRDVTERERARAEVQRWADAFASCAHGIALGDPVTGNLSACNPALARLLGFEPAELVGRPIASIYDPAIHGMVRDAIAAADREGSVHYEARMVRRDGATVPVAVDLTTIPGEDRQPLYRVATVVDIRDRDRASEQIQLQARLLELAFDPTMVWELGGSIRFWNDGAARLYGFTRAQALGHRPHDLLATREEAGLHARLEALERDGEWSGLVAHRAADGRALEVESRQQVVRDASGQRLVLETNRDVTERRGLIHALAAREQQLRLFIDHAPAAIAMFDRDMRYVAASQRWIADYGLGGAPLAGRCHYDLFPEIGEAWKAVHRRGLAGEVITADPDRFERADGTAQWLRWEVRPWYDPAGAVGGIVIFAEDITQPVEAQRAVAESEQRLSTVIENIAEGIVTADGEGRVQHWNRAAMEMFGFERREDWLLALSELAEWFQVSTTSGDHLSYDEWPLARVIAGESVRGMEIWVRRRDIPWERVFSCNGLRVREPNGHELAILSLADVTERKRAERALEERTVELARSNTDLEQFAYVASHDLKEPLRAVAGCVSLLERRYRDQLDERGGELIRHAVEGSTRMQQLIDDLLAYSRVGTRGARFAPVALDEALDAALRNLAVSITESGAEVSREGLPTVEADAAQLTSVLQNLLGNALKFCTRAPRIHVSARRDGEAWVVSVADDGIGVAPEFAERIFGVFQRLHTRTEYPGTGIGLAICKKIVERHGGRIWLESAPGAGATFHFSLPSRASVATEPR